jgi:hypothetical protein
MSNYQQLNLDDLKAIDRAVFSTLDVATEGGLKIATGVREAITIAERFHPTEAVVLARSVFQRRPESPMKRVKSKRLEEILQLYGFTIRPVGKLWHVGHGDVVDPTNKSVGISKNLKEAVAQAIANQLRNEQEERNSKHDSSTA